MPTMQEQLASQNKINANLANPKPKAEPKKATPKTRGKKKDDTESDSEA